jgi:hypothetical protein
MADGNKASVHEIASTLLQAADEGEQKAKAKQQATPAEAEDEVTLNEGNDDEATSDDELEDEGSADDADEDEQSDDPEATDDGEGDDEEDTDDDNDADSTDVLDINDDDLIEVKIDGKIEYRSIAEAKKALSGEGAYDKRVKEATELRKQAQAEHTQMLERFSEANKNFANVLNTLEQQLFKPQVKKPDASMKQSNPDQYYRQLADYQAEQDTLNEGKKQLYALAQRQQAELQKQRDEYRKEQAQLLKQRLPELTNQEKAQPLVQNMVETAKAYGFTEEEINSALDHRYYMMVADLAKYRGARGATKRKANTVKNLEGQQNKRPRKLRSGATALKAKTRKQQNQQKKVTETARKTGKVKDVAATLISKRG